MRYLKYNEEFTGMTDPNLIKLTDDLKNFANDSLAYLIDDGFSVSVGRKSYLVDLYNPIKGYLPEFSILKRKGEVDEYNTAKVEKFTWEEIKDDFIPFIEMCNEKYLFMNGAIFNTFGFHQVQIDDLINDNLTPTLLKDLVGIRFYIQGYKIRK
jgi:hypothetical protein